MLFYEGLSGGYETTEKGELIDCNEAFARIFGYRSREDCLRRWVLTDHLPPEVRTAFVAELRKHRKLLGLESCVRHKDGNALWICENAILIEGGEHGEPDIFAGTLFLDQHRGDILVLPDILCNAGGVIVSYFEWVQGLQQFFWDETEVSIDSIGRSNAPTSGY